LWTVHWGRNLGYLGVAIFPHSCVSRFSFLVLLPPVSAVIPLQVEQFALELWLHPNQQQVNNVLRDGLHRGFKLLKLGFSKSKKLKRAKKNKPSTA